MASPTRRFARFATLLLATALVAACLYEGFFVTPYDLRIVRQDVPCAGLKREPIRVLLLSDVDFPHYRSNLDRAAEAARAFDPDLVFVAGDFLDRGSTVADPDVRRAAREWFEGLPAPGRRLLAPGEEESPALDRLRRAWPAEVIEPVANERRRFEIRGESVDVFVADLETDPAPWGVFEDGDRWVLGAHARRRETYVELARPDFQSWGTIEVSLALRIGRPEGRIVLQVAADPDADPRVGDAFSIVQDGYDPGFRLQARWPGSRRLEGSTRSAFVPPIGAWFRCRIRVADEERATRIQARFWAEGDEEPARWMIDAAASGANRRRRGTVALGGARGRVQFADLAVTDGAGRPLFGETFDDRQRFLAHWRQWSRLAEWLASPDDGTARLILSHSPDVALDVQALGGVPPSAIVAGHTHGGQVGLPWFGPVFTATFLGRKYDRGFFILDGTPLFITAGVGTSIIPIRFGVPPDVALLTFRPGVSSWP